MALTDTQQKIDDLYWTNFGRGASFGTTGGADYWANKVDNEGLSWDDLGTALHGSDEGVKHRGEHEDTRYKKGNVYVGGIDESRSIESQSGPGFWGDHFRENGVFEHMNAAAKADAIAKDIGHTPSEDYFNNTLGGTKNSIIKLIEGDKNKDIIKKITGGIDGIDGIDGKDGKDGKDGITLEDLDAWWAKQNQGGDKKEGMDDFMKFMMLMSVMRPGGGGGYGGSQYGYGGLNPGGVQSAYNPWDNMTKGWDFMKTAFGAGSDDTTTTALTNAT